MRFKRLFYIDPYWIRFQCAVLSNSELLSIERFFRCFMRHEELTEKETTVDQLNAFLNEWMNEEDVKMMQNRNFENRSNYCCVWQIWNHFYHTVPLNDWVRLNIHKHSPNVFCQLLRENWAMRVILHNILLARKSCEINNIKWMRPAYEKKIAMWHYA